MAEIEAMSDAAYIAWYAAFCRDNKAARDKGYEPPEETYPLLLRLHQKALAAWGRVVWPKILARREAEKAKQRAKRLAEALGNSE